MSSFGSLSGSIASVSVFEMIFFGRHRISKQYNKVNPQLEAHSAYFLSLEIPLMDCKVTPRRVAKHN